MVTGYPVDHEEFGRVHAAMQASDPELAERVAAVWHGLVRDVLTVVWQDRLQSFLWHEVPQGLLPRWPGGEVDPAEVVVAASALFEALEWRGYAALCCSSTTAGVHAAFRRSTEAGHRAAERAAERSGVLPPTLDDGFSFSTVAGPGEFSVRILVARALEAAVTSGQLVVGRSGWRTQQRALMAAVLDSPHPELPTQSFRSVITTERLERWIDLARQRSARLGALRERYAGQLLKSRDRPSDYTDRLAALLWVLDQTSHPEPPSSWPDDPLLRSVAAACFDRQWWGPDARQPAGTAGSEVPCPYYMLALGRRARAYASRNGRQVLTPAGRRMLADPALAWDTMVDNLSSADHDILGRIAVESAVLLLVDAPERSLPAGTLWTQIAEFAIELGWDRLTENPHGVDLQDRLGDINWWLFHSIHAGLLTVDDVPDRYMHIADDAAITLTPTGLDVLLTHVSRNATGPANYLLRPPQP